jgi:hypothetical protein
MNIKELIPFLEEKKALVKIHCARGSKDEYAPKKEFLKGKFKEWQEEQNKKNFERQYILSLIFWGKDEWLFAGVYESLNVKQNDKGGYIYETKLLDIANEFIGRAIFVFRKEFRNSYLCLEKHIDNINLLEIKRDFVTPKFPGYDQVNVSWKDLSDYIESDSWKTALENQKGVYLITDISNGKKYVGSAYGQEMILGRWRDYVQNGHGGNKELKTFKFDYIKNNFRYSILEIFKYTTDDNTIITRESWWKEVLMTREFGYNKN